MEVREAIKAMLKGKGITQTELAEKLGTNQSNIAMFMKSGMAMKTENLVKIANACGYDVVLSNREDRNDTYVIGEGESLPKVSANGFEDAIRRIVAEELCKIGETNPAKKTKKAVAE